MLMHPHLFYLQFQSCCLCLLHTLIMPYQPAQGLLKMPTFHSYRYGFLPLMNSCSALCIPNDSLDGSTCRLLYVCLRTYVLDKDDGAVCPLCLVELAIELVCLDISGNQPYCSTFRQLHRNVKDLGDRSRLEKTKLNKCNIRKSLSKKLA